MGNYISCTLSAAAVGGRAQKPKVILPGGDVQHLGAEPATAAELMLDHPGYFLVHSSALLINRRLFALSADEDLEFGAVYAMFPMDRLGSAATATDMGRLLLVAGKQARRARAQVAPVHSVGPVSTPEFGDGSIAEFRYRPSLCRSKRPALETITEETVC